jgi:hypothetical protein
VIRPEKKQIYGLHSGMKCKAIDSFDGIQDTIFQGTMRQNFDHSTQQAENVGILLENESRSVPRWPRHSLVRTVQANSSQLLS